MNKGLQVSRQTDVQLLIFSRYLHIERIHTWMSYLAWKTLPNAPSPISLTYSILFLGYSKLSSLGLRRRGIRWYMGLGCSRSRRSSEGRVVSVGVSDSLKQQSSCWSMCMAPDLHLYHGVGFFQGGKKRCGRAAEKTLQQSLTISPK